MKSEQFDFYSPTNLKSYNLEQTMRYQIEVLGQLDMFTRRHSENVANLCCRICEYLHISETLKDLIKDTQPDPKFMALDFLAEKEKVGKINGKILKQLFKVVIDDTNYEISCVLQYVDYLKDQIKRLELMKRYYTKMTETTKEKTKAYYKEGIRLLLQTGETMENFEQVLEEYKSALIIRNKRIDDLYNEIKIIKRLKV